MSSCCQQCILLPSQPSWWVQRVLGSAVLPAPCHEDRIADLSRHPLLEAACYQLPCCARAAVVMPLLLLMHPWQF